MDNQNNLNQGLPPQAVPNSMPPMSATGNSQPYPAYPSAGMSPTNVAMAQSPNVGTAHKGDTARIIALVIVSILAITFLGLFIWMFVRWDDAKTNLNAKIDEAVAISENELEAKLESEFAEREKTPYKTFAGPVDYGELTFEYPKTWSLYVGEEGNNGSDYRAYFNPGAVKSADGENVMALRVSIVNNSTEDVLQEYQSYLGEGAMTMSTRLINGSNASLFEGTLPNQRVGKIVIIKIRDKTATIQTDAEIFYEDYNRILDTIRFTL